MPERDLCITIAPHVKVSLNGHVVEPVTVNTDVFGYTVTLNKEENGNIPDEQKKLMTSLIFKDEGVLYQLRQAQ